MTSATTVNNTDAASSGAAVPIMLTELRLPTMKPVTSCRKTNGIFFWLQFMMKRAALSALSL